MAKRKAVAGMARMDGLTDAQAAARTASRDKGRAKNVHDRQRKITMRNLLDKYFSKGGACGQSGAEVDG